ncbi:MAG: M23 family peptidase [Thermodesulfatator sp.]|nr:MAG: M23 family peptidase [Thermodesulfatator sp.]
MKIEFFHRACGPRVIVMFSSLMAFCICFWVILNVFPERVFAETGPGVQWDIKPAYLSQGGICRVILKTEPESRILAVSFGSRNLVLKRLTDNTYMGLIGAGLKEKPGSKTLQVKVIQKGKHAKIVKIPVVIKGKKYPEEHLRVSRKMVEFPPDILKRVLADQKAVKNACSQVTKRIYWDLPFIWPVRSKLLSPFGLRRFFNEQPRSPHSGVDLRAKTGTPIKAPNNARVALVRNCYLSGNTVVLDHGGGLYTLYAHLSRVDIKNGQEVQKGQVIGLAGATGRATGPHLHWGVSLFGTRVDPAQFMDLVGQ